MGTGCIDQRNAPLATFAELPAKLHRKFKSAGAAPDDDNAVRIARFYLIQNRLLAWDSCMRQAASFCKS